MSAPAKCPGYLAAGRFRRQAGMTLMETMISLALSLVVTSAMVVLMANSLGSASRIILMTQLTDELRNTMSMLTRDIRRANYSVNAAYCYANADCGLEVATEQFADIDVSDGTCVSFGLDRDFDGVSATDSAGGFRLWPMVIDGQSRGAMFMWIGDNSVDCSVDPDPSDVNSPWVAITDPEFVNITTFVANDADSFTGSITGEAGATITQRTRQILVQIEGELVRDPRITRRIEDVIKVRNDLISTS